jgi:hypothetical protein
MASKANKKVTVRVPDHQRDVGLSLVQLTCGWCNKEETQERYPGSFLPVLCPTCRTLYRAWQRANYYLRDAGKALLTLPEWAARRRARGSKVPDVPGDADGLSSLTDGLGLLHVPANLAEDRRPVRGQRAQHILAARNRSLRKR